MKKIISFSLFGKKISYVIGAILNADIAEKEWPDWICRFYVDTSVPKEAIKELSSRKNTEIFIMKEEEGWNGTLWRFYPCSDNTVDVMISRDCDSRLSVRDKAAVDEWLKSDKKFHILRDCCQHGWPICAGMWGARDGIVSNMIDLILNYPKHLNKDRTIDQKFLAQIIYPRITEAAYVHDDWFPCTYTHENKHPFPIQRLRGEGWWNTQFPEWHSGIEDNPKKYHGWFIDNMPGHCYLLCPDCNKYHDNEYIGKFVYISDDDKQKYLNIVKECE